MTNPFDTLDGSGNPTNGTLRWAFEQADQATSASTIEFDSSVFGTTPQTINLTQGLLLLGNSKFAIEVDGPAGGVTIDGGNASAVIGVIEHTTVNLSELTITGGNAARRRRDQQLRQPYLDRLHHQRQLRQL